MSERYCSPSISIGIEIFRFGGNNSSFAALMVVTLQLSSMPQEFKDYLQTYAVLMTFERTRGKD